MDKRTKKTIDALCDSYIALTCENKEQKIKIIDLCKMAKINKATFYRHYKDVDELRVDAIKRLVDKLGIYAATCGLPHETLADSIKVAIASYRHYSKEVKAFSDDSLFLLSLYEPRCQAYLKRKFKLDVDNITISYLSVGLVYTTLKYHDTLTDEDVEKMSRIALSVCESEKA